MLTSLDINLAIILALSFIAFTIALYFDLRFHRIPNSLCFFVIIIGCTAQIYLNHWQGLLNAFMGFGAALVILFPAFMFKALGAGDVKLMMAVGTLLGPTFITWSILYAVAFGAITSIVLVIYKTGWQGMKSTLIRYYHCFYLKEYFKPSEGEAAAHRVPYAPALMLGWLWACSQNEDVLWVISNVKYTLFS